MNKAFQNNSGDSDLSLMDYLDLTNPVFSEDANPEKSGEKYIVFFLNEVCYAVSSRTIAEITQPLKAAVLPNTPDWLLGLANLRGEIISVVDPEKLWNKNAASSAGKSKFIVLRSDESAATFALAVDRLGEIITLPDENITPLGEDENFPHLLGKAIHNSHTFRIMDAENFPASLHFST